MLYQSSLQTTKTALFIHNLFVPNEVQKSQCVPTAPFKKVITLRDLQTSFPMFNIDLLSNV